MARYLIYSPDRLNDPQQGYMAYVSSNVEVSAYMQRNYPNVLWEHSSGIFDSTFTMPELAVGDDLTVRGMYAFSDEYVRFIVRRAS